MQPPASVDLEFRLGTGKKVAVTSAGLFMGLNDAYIADDHRMQAPEFGREWQATLRILAGDPVEVQDFSLKIHQTHQPVNHNGLTDFSDDDDLR